MSICNTFVVLYGPQGPPGLPGVGGPKGEKVSSLHPHIQASYFSVSPYLLQATHDFVI